MEDKQLKHILKVGPELSELIWNINTLLYILDSPAIDQRAHVEKISLRTYIFYWNLSILV